MAKRHAVTMEAGGWILLFASIALLIWIFFSKSGKGFVTVKLGNQQYQSMTPALADAIASGQVQARALNPGDVPNANEDVFQDPGTGTLWAVTRTSAGANLS